MPSLSECHSLCSYLMSRGISGENQLRQRLRILRNRFGSSLSKYNNTFVLLLRMYEDPAQFCLSAAATAPAAIDTAVLPLLVHRTP